MFSRTTTKIGALADRTRDSVEGAEVDVQIQLETKPQQQSPLHHPRRHRRRPDRWTDGTEQDGVDGPELLEDRVGQDLTGPLVVGGAEVVADVSSVTPAAATTLSASAITSGPIPSPPITATLCTPSPVAVRVSDRFICRLPP